ncbi:MAG: AMP-binding protein, partial [Actinomycetales bacterium]
MSLPERVAALGDGLAIVDGAGARDRASLIRRAAAVRQALQTAGLGPNGEIGARVAVLGRPGADWCAALFGAWSAGAIVVPLHHRHPADELAYRLDDAQVSIVLATDELGSMARALAARCAARVVTLLGSAETVGAGGLGAGGVVPVTSEALIVHTSGTTGRPKGVVHTHRSLAAQAAAMIEAWGWSADDRTLCVLPLDHVHGIVNATLTPLSVGAVVEMADGFEAETVWERFASGELTVFTAVPTVYARLVRAWEQADDATRRRWSDGAAQLRLMISGSAALPVTVLERWREISGHVLLERYGMTELGMVLGNTLDRRVPGHVGWPFPGVEVRVDTASSELLVRGPQVF